MKQNQRGAVKIFLHSDLWELLKKALVLSQMEMYKTVP